MTVLVNCPSCGTATEVRAGRPARCPGCGAEVSPPARRDRGPALLLGGWLALAGCAAVVGWALLRSDAPAEEPHDWRPEVFPDAGVRVEVPAAPRNVARVSGVRLPPGVLTAGTALPGRREEYAVLCTEVNPARRKAETDDALVAGAVAALLGDDPPARKTAERPAELGGYPGREVAYEVLDRGVSGVVRVAVVGDRLFRAAVAGPGVTPDDDRARRFLDSFAVTDPELLARARARAEAARVAELAARRPVGFATIARIEPHHACAFDPARGAFWTVTDRGGGDALGRPNGRRYFLRRYSYPGFRPEGEYRVWEPTVAAAVIGDRLYLTENPAGPGGDPRLEPKPKVAAYDLRALPAAAADPPLLTPDTRADVPGGSNPGTGVRGLVADPAGRWLFVVSAGNYQQAHVTRVAADLSGTPASLAMHGVTISSSASVSPDGATLSVATGTQTETTWVDIDVAEWRVRRKESGPGRHYSSWVRWPDRTFAVESEGKKLDELRWDGRRAAAAAPAAEVRPRFLRASPDGRFLFCLCAPEAGGPAVLRAFRTDAPSGTVRPACGSTPVEAITNLHYRFVVAPDGGAIVPVTGQVFGVTYPPAD